jgi:outer membrane protein assembly factor BamD
MYKNIVILILSIYIFTACSSKHANAEYNKPAIYWYNKMLQQISSGELDKANDTFTSLESEHKYSPLLSSANIIIAKAYINSEEYELANYYLDKYLKKFSNTTDVDYIRYLKIKSKFLAFKNQFREQQLMYKTIKETDTFIKKYPNSKYIYLVDTIRSRLLMARASFDKEISELYKRRDKKEASKLYEIKVKQSWQDFKNVKKVDIPWYRALFE